MLPVRTQAGHRDERSLLGFVGESESNAEGGGQRAVCPVGDLQVLVGCLGLARLQHRRGTGDTHGVLLCWSPVDAGRSWYLPNTVSATVNKYLLNE